MKIKVENFTINLHRAEESSCQDEIKRLTKYVYTICEIGKRQEKLVLDNVAMLQKGIEK